MVNWQGGGGVNEEGGERGNKGGCKLRFSSCNFLVKLKSVLVELKNQFVWPQNSTNSSDFFETPPLYSEIGFACVLLDMPQKRCQNEKRIHAEKIASPEHI